MRVLNEIENAMEVVITVHMPTEDGQDFTLMAALDVVDALSQTGAITAAAAMADQYGFEGELAGVRLAFSDKPVLLSGEEFIEGGIEALMGIRRTRDRASGDVSGYADGLNRPPRD